MSDLAVIRLKPKAKPQAIRHGFPWVFADEAVLDRRTRAVAPGEFAVLEDAERRPLALVTVNPASKIVARVMDADPAKLNVNGGAIALGHPLGATGTKLMATLVHALKARGKKYGLQTMCEGGGVANVTIVEAL